MSTSITTFVKPDALQSKYAALDLELSNIKTMLQKVLDDRANFERKMTAEKLRIERQFHAHSEEYASRTDTQILELTKSIDFMLEEQRDIDAALQSCGTPPPATSAAPAPATRPAAKRTATDVDSSNDGAPLSSSPKLN